MISSHPNTQLRNTRYYFRGNVASSLNLASTGLPTKLPPPKSPLPVFRNACPIVSTLSSPPTSPGEPPCPKLPALPGNAPGNSKPLTEGAPEVGGLGAWEDAGLRRGEGERLDVRVWEFAWERVCEFAWEREWEREDKSPACMCSPCTTSAKEMKLNLRTSAESREP